MSDPKSERARLEAEIAQLRRDIDAAAAALDVAREQGKRPRGFGIGLVVGSALVLSAIGVMAYAFANFMSHYG